MTRDTLPEVETLVVKVGSSLLARAGGGVDTPFIYRLVGELACLHARGVKTVLVSSGAVAAGMAELGLSERPRALPEVQAAAAVGQSALMQLYRNAFQYHKITVAQVLLTRDGLRDRVRYLHARNTLRALLERNALPVVNENDTVAVEELRLKLGDNDGLAVSVSQLVDADCLVLLTDVPGLYDRPPAEGEADLISHVSEVTPELLAKATGSISGVGSGGMAAKLNAARAAALAGIPLVVAPGARENVLRDLLAGKEIGTFFSPRDKRESSRRQWIACGRKPDGALVVDAGAARVVAEGKKSLLAIGVREVRGEFYEGDTVSVLSPEGLELARGLVNFSSAELELIKGLNSADFAETLGYECGETVVHRDNLVLI